MNAKQVQEQLEILFSNHDHHFLNKYIFGYDWESDFFSVTKSGYMYEVEVKISKSDFSADFIKFKHKLFENRKEKSVIKEAKFRKKRGKIRKISADKSVNIQDVKMPNKFFFACPEGLLLIEDIPEYAGLIYVSERGAEVIKQAPMLHKKKEDIKELLFSKYQWGYINTKIELENLERKHKSVTNKLEALCRGLEVNFKLPEGSVTSITALKKIIKESK